VIGPQIGSNAIAGVVDGVGSVLNCPHIRPWSHPGLGVSGSVDNLSTVYCQGSSGFRIVSKLKATPRGYSLLMLHGI
jgi:hypothetical protein